MDKHGQERPKKRVAETKQRPGPASIGVRTGRSVAADGPPTRCQLIPQFKPKQPLGLVGVGVLEDLARVAGVPRAALAVALRDAVALLRVPVARAKVHPARTMLQPLVPTVHR